MTCDSLRSKIQSHPTLPRLPLTELKGPELSVLVEEFSWQILDPCADALVLATLSHIRLGNKNASPGVPQVPIFVCDV